MAKYKFKPFVKHVGKVVSMNDDSTKYKTIATSTIDQPFERKMPDDGGLADPFVTVKGDPKVHAHKDWLIEVS